MGFTLFVTANDSVPGAEKEAYGLILLGKPFHASRYDVA